MRGLRGELGRWGLAVWILLLARTAAALEVRVRSEGADAPTRVVIDVDGTTPAVVDRTPDARPASEGRLGSGTTFADEITLDLPGVHLVRPLAVDVSDDLVTAVRALPSETGCRVVVFVRRPVTYEIRPVEEGGGLALTLTAARSGDAAGEGRARADGDDERVSVDADEVSYDRARDTVSARGGVTISRGTMTLRADEVEYARTDEIARARGRVSLLDPEMTVHGSAAEVNLADELGWVEDADADLPENRYRVQAGRIEKCGPVSYRAENGTFTTCRCGGLEKPTWSVSSARTDVTLGSYGTARDARFHLRDVPVLYLPQLVFPAATQRQSGLLLPNVGYSNRDGFQLQQPFYWAIDKSSDATVVADLQTEARVGGAVEYRYVLSEKARGAFSGLYYNEHIGGNLDRSEARDIQVGDRDIPENRFAFFGRHAQPFVAGSTWYLDLFALSDDLFLREIDVPSAVDVGWHPHNTRFTRSRTGVIETWNGGLLQLETAYFQDLVDPQELTLQEVPRIAAEHAVPLLGGHLVARLAGDTTMFLREQGFDGWRTQIAPEVYVPFQLGRFAYGSVRGLVREQLYYLADTEQVGLAFPDNPNILPRFRQAPEGLLPELDRTHAQDSAEVVARLGTQFARVYDFPHWGFERLRHTIEPEVRFTYVPDVDRTFETVTLPPCTGAPNERTGIDCDGRLFTEPYLFDQDDAINKRTFLAYGLTTRLFGRLAAPEVAPAGPGARAVAAPAPSPPRELARFSVLHGYDVTRRLVNDSHASDIDLAFRLTPVRFGGLGYNATVSFQESKLIGQSVGLFLREPWTPPKGLEDLQQPSMLVAAYRFVTENASRGLAPNSAEERLFRNTGVEELSAGIYLRLGDRLGFSYLSRYDFTTSVVPGRETVGPHFLEQTFVLRLLSRCNCWMLDIGVRDRFDTDETSAVVQLTLVGLGGGGTGGTAGLRHGFGAIPGLATTPRFGAEGRNW
jgi:LPS-assembly protein